MIDDEEFLISEKIIKKGLRKDIYDRVKEFSNEGGVNEWIEEVQKKLFHFKDFAFLREKMSKFYQNKLSNKLKIIID